MKGHHKIVELHRGMRKIIHWVPRLEMGDKGWYISTVSLSAFRDRNLKRLQKAMHERKESTLPVRFQVIWRYPDGELDEINLRSVIEEKYGLDFSELDAGVEKVHTGLFDFYRDVGYDWKRDKLPNLEDREKAVK